MMSTFIIGEMFWVCKVCLPSKVHYSTKNVAYRMVTYAIDEYYKLGESTTMEALKNALL
jgi:hypothetical protein